jgi:transposase
MHGSATTTPDIRRAIQNSGQSIRALAHAYGLNPKTVVKWKARKSADDLPMGAKDPRPKALTPTEEATCVAFRIQARLPLDDCLYALQLMFPQLTRSTLHRLFQRYDIHCLPVADARQSAQHDTIQAELGHFYLDSADIRTGDGRANMFFAFDRTSKIAFARLYNTAEPHNAPAFLDALINALPYAIRSVRTGTGSQFTTRQSAVYSEHASTSSHPFIQACLERHILHDVLPPDQPWNIGQIGSVKSAASAAIDVQVHYPGHNDLQEHFLAFFKTYNFSRRLKTLRGLTPFEFVCQRYMETPIQFHASPQKYRRALSG